MFLLSIHGASVGGLGHLYDKLPYVTACFVNRGGLRSYPTVVGYLFEGKLRISPALLEVTLQQM